MSSRAATGPVLPTKRPRGRLPAAIHLAAAVVVGLLVVAIALRANGAPPPAIAEFAPTANHPIQNAPNEQTGSFGSGSGSASGAAATPTPSPAQVPAAAVFLRCVGDPPRQIEDPQSPPCVPFWSGDNGGATSRGVTASGITIVWPEQDYAEQGSTGPTANFYAEARLGYQNFFNHRFELYGRSVNLVLIPGNDFSDSGERSEADQVAQQIRAFGSMQWDDLGGEPYHEELAAQRVVSASGWEAAVPESRADNFAPYLWQYPAAVDMQMRALGQWYCSRLNGHVASHAGDPVLQTRQRKLGVVWEPFNNDAGTPQPLLDSLRTCGVAPDLVERASGGSTDDVQGESNAIAQFRVDGVTSVLVLAETFYYSEATHVATSQGYAPEWLLSTFGSNDTDWTFHFLDPDTAQAAHTFGLTFQPRQEQVGSDPGWWAWHEGDPSSPPPSNLADIYVMQRFYRSLLLLMSGIQMAGPHLTPEAFQAALQKTAFPNPDTSLYAGHVGFAGGSHAMTVDAAEWWYDPTATSAYAQYGAGEGALCYVAGGRRHGLGDWPPPGTPDQFFQGACGAF